MEQEQLQKINNQVKELLQQQPKLRGIFQRAQFIWEFWKKYYGISQFGISEKTWINLYRVANPETIARAIRKVQKEHPELKDEKTNDERYKEANLFRQFHNNNEQNQNS